MQSYNITEGLEAAEYSWRHTKPVTMTGTATGESETLNFTGSTLAMKSLAQRYLEEGYTSLTGGGMQVSCTVTRGEADMAKLQVTRTWYGSAASDDTGGSSPSAPPASAAGSSESSPCRTISFSDVQESILTHPIVKAEIDNWGPKSRQAIALRMLMKGADMEEPFTVLQDGKTQVWTVGDALEHVSDAAVELVSRQEFFLDQLITVSDKFEIPGDSQLPDFGQYPRIEAPSFSPQLSGGRNWLFLGGEITREGDRIMVTKNYKSSAAGGWNPATYGNE